MKQKIIAIFNVALVFWLLFIVALISTAGCSMSSSKKMYRGKLIMYSATCQHKCESIMKDTCYENYKIYRRDGSKILFYCA